MRGYPAFALLLAACGFSGSAVSRDGGTDGNGVDAALDAFVPAPDAGPCQTLGATCVASTVRTCGVVNQQPTDELCNVSCSTSGGAHCTRLQPSGGGVVPGDLDPEANVDAPVVIASATLNSDDGSITGVRTAGTGPISKIDYQVNNGIAVFRVQSLSITGTLTLTGSKPVAFASTTTIAVSGLVNAQGACAGMAAVAGGRNGGGIGNAGGGSGGGMGGTGSHNDSSGGAGGAYGGQGGGGGASDSPRVGTMMSAVYGNDTITTLVGGSGGGGGGGSGAGTGGGGGGAIQLIANASITFVGTGGINAGGCGGHKKTSNQNDGGGGGGSGGTILLEAPTINLLATTVLAVNGGGGSGGDQNGADGGPGQLARAQAAGGVGDSAGASGAGGAVIAGATAATGANGGGGGGAVGRMRFNLLGGDLTTAILSPGLADPGTTATQSPLAIQ